MNAIDLRGHGRCTNPTGQFTHRQAALDVYALLDQLGIGRFKGFGFSSGGISLLHMATQQPQRVEAMITSGATIYFPEQCRERQRLANADGPNVHWGHLRRTHRHGDGQIRALFDQFRSFGDSHDDMNFTPPYLATITARTLIVHGDRDPFSVSRYPSRCTAASLIPTSGSCPTGGTACQGKGLSSATSTPVGP